MSQVTGNKRQRAPSTRPLETRAQILDAAAKQFIAAIALQYPKAPPQAVASCFVFTVSAMLSLCTSTWRVSALGQIPSALDQEMIVQDLTTFCEAGMHRVLEPVVTSNIPA